MSNATAHLSKITGARLQDGHRLAIREGAYGLSFAQARDLEAGTYEIAEVVNITARRIHGGSELTIELADGRVVTGTRTRSPLYVAASSVHTATSGSRYTFTLTGPRVGELTLGYGHDPVVVDTDVSPDEIEVAVDRADEELRTLMAAEA